MNKRTFTKATSGMLVALLVVVMLFAGFANTVGRVAAEATGYTSDAEYIKEIGNIDTRFEQYLDKSAVFQLPDTVSDDDEISVIVMLDHPSLIETYNKGGKTSFTQYSVSSAAEKLRTKIGKDKTEILAKLDEVGVEYDVGADYYAILSGFEVVIKAAYFDELCSSLGDNATAVVSEVFNAAETQLVENDVNVYDTGIFDSSNFGYDGSGMVVAVLDTGLDYTHSAFSPDYLTSNTLGLTMSEVSAVLGSTNASKIALGLSTSDVYVNDKVPFAFDYADRDSDVYSIHNNHGTHVSGVIVGNDYNAETRPEGIIGVAPNAQLVSMKIFSDTYDSAYASWILSALEDCVILGVDVINMSLGTACGFSRESDEEIISGVYDRIRAQGISLIVAASNSYASSQGSEKNGNLGLTTNPDTATVGSPSTYDGALSIASISGTPSPYLLYKGNIVYFIESSDSKNDERNFVDEILGDSVDSKTFEYIKIPGVGRMGDYNGIDVEGKIVLVRRGDTTFEEKANAAQQNNAAGIIIYNNTSGEIRMNVGLSTIPTISISQDDGETLAAAKTGTITISRSQTSGPFISDFSSWGPSPDLGIKPEITAHGGNIYSSVTGGEYDRLSGTSMACPNIAGVATLLRQYVIANFTDEITLQNGDIDYREVNAIVNRLMMSTADILYNKNGLPYAVRKQGAGLANLDDCADTLAYILTYDRVDGSVMDKTKIELGDDPAKSGVYTLRFSVYNFGTTDLSYNISASVMTEGVYGTPTYAGLTTVTTEGYLLDAKVEVAGEGCNGKTLTVGAGKTADVTVTITLSEEDKAYLDKSFKNGMYIEGFVSLEAVDGTDVDLNAPYLAFYGDWTKAPLFDIDYFETNGDELDDSIALLDKTLPDAYASRPIGGIELDYVSYLGSYYFIQNPQHKIIAADRDYIALSNVEGTIHSLRFVWMGLLRNAAKIEVSIVDDATGEVVFQTVEENVRKSYGDGGSYIYPANVDIEFDAAEHNLKNNTTYTVKLQGYVDYGDGGLTTNLNNTFEFPLTTDFLAPALTGVEYRVEYDRSDKKNRLYATFAVYDNHYAMSIMPGYLTAADESSEYSTVLNGFSNYLTPVYSSRNSTTYVEFELTDYIYDIKNKGLDPNSFVVSTYDYAMNTATYEVPLPAEYLDVYVKEEDMSITLSPNEVYAITPLVHPNTEWPELLNYQSTNEKVVRVVNGKLVAVGTGKARINISDPKDTTNNIRIDVTVLGPEDEGYKRISKPVAAEFKLDSYTTLKAYYFMDSNDREIGEVGNIRIFEGVSYLSMYPSESVDVSYTLAAYFPEDVEVRFSSGNPNVATVDQNGVITAQGKGTTSVSVTVYMDGARTNYAKTISISVKDPYVRNGPILTNYYGLGGVVEIPSNMMFTEIGQFAFSNYEYVEKGEGDEISEDDPNATKPVFIGDDTITKVIIPEGVEKIGSYAFANLSALREVVLPSTLKYIEYGAFYQCKNLETVKGLEHVVTINKYAFQGCQIKGPVNLSSAHAIADYAFASLFVEEIDQSTGEPTYKTYRNQITKLTIPETLRSIGAHAFSDNRSLKEVVINAEKIKLGEYAFENCNQLESININATVIPFGAFYGCTSLENVTLGKDVTAINAEAFARTRVERFNFAEGNTAFLQSADGRFLLSTDGKTILYASPALSGNIVIDDANITTIAAGAFAGNRAITAVTAPSVTKVEAYAFADCSGLRTVNLGELTLIDDYSFSGTGITAHPSFNALTEIGAYAFAGSALESVIIPEGITVGEGCFVDCGQLRTVTVEDGATIGFGAFMTTRYPQLMREGNSNLYSVYMASSITTVSIGDNVTIGDSAFFCSTALSSLSIGENVYIGSQAFYNATALTVVDLHGATYIGSRAFSGDVYNKYVLDTQTGETSPAVADGYYVYTYHAPNIRQADLSNATYIGENAFQFCTALESVILSDELTRVPDYAFDNCPELSVVNLGQVQFIGEAAFSRCSLEAVDLSSAIRIGGYAFAENTTLRSAILSAEGTELGEGVFSLCSALASVANLESCEIIGAYAFAYTAILDIDLTNAVHIGDLAFYKDSTIPVRINLTLGDKVQYIGDNPFAMCEIAENNFEKVVTETVNGVEYVTHTRTYDLNDYIRIIDGSIYAKVPYGYELITFVSQGNENAEVPEETVRITAMAFAGSDVVRVTLPLTLNSIGHKAFYLCPNLTTVIFKSYEAPKLEEEFDQSYFMSYENIPATGDYEFTDSDGNEIIFSGLEIVPYFMIDATANYSNAFYGATFIDYIGKGEDKLVMVRPSNGRYYDSFLYDQYFSVYVDGATAPDDNTLAAIEAINRLPSSITLAHEELVIAAREAYNKVGTLDQQHLVTNRNTLANAERTIAALKSLQDEDNNDNDTPTDPKPEDNKTEPESKDDVVLMVMVIVLSLAVIILCGTIIKNKKKLGQDTVDILYENGIPDKDGANEDAEESGEVDESETEEDDRKEDEI